MAFSFGCYAQTTGNPPLSGLGLTSGAWVAYYDVTTGADPGGHPGFTEPNAKGIYETTPGPSIAGLIDTGMTTITRYVFVAPESGTAFPAFIASSGAPATGLSLTGGSWQALFDAGTGSPITPPTPAFTELGGGLYRANGLPSNAVGRIDLGGAQNPRYYEVGVAPSLTGPVLGNPTPDPLAGPIGSAQPLGFTVTDPGVSASALLTTITISFPSGSIELVYAPIVGFSPLYSGGSSLPAGVPGTYAVTRNGPWPASPTLSVSLSDNNGNSTSGFWTWMLAPATVSAGIASAANIVPAIAPIYGSDVRFFPDLDPYMLIITDPRTVMMECLARSVGTPQGSLFFAPNACFGLNQYLNRALSPQDVLDLQASMVSAILLDQRVLSVNVVAALDDTGRVLSVVVQGSGAAGPFTVIFTVSSVTAGQFISAINFE